MSPIPVGILQGMEWCTESKRAALLYLQGRRATSTVQICTQLQHYGVTFNTLRELSEPGVTKTAKPLIEFVGSAEEKEDRQGSWRISVEGAALAKTVRDELNKESR